MPSISQNAPEITEAEAEKITSMVMRRQMRLSLSVASIFILLLFGLPLVNTYAPEVANQRVFGFTLTWLILGVLVYPVTVLLAFYFVKSSDRIEAEAHRFVKSSDRIEAEAHRQIVSRSDDGSAPNNGGRL